MYRDSQYTQSVRQLWREGAVCSIHTDTHVRFTIHNHIIHRVVCNAVSARRTTVPQAASRNNAVAISIAPIGPGLLRGAPVLLAALMAALLARRHSSLGGWQPRASVTEPLPPRGRRVERSASCQTRGPEGRVTVATCRGKQPCDEQPQLWPLGCMLAAPLANAGRARGRLTGRSWH